MQGVQVKLCYPLTMHAKPKYLREASCVGAIETDYIYLYLYRDNESVHSVILVWHGEDHVPRQTL